MDATAQAKRSLTVWEFAAETRTLCGLRLWPADWRKAAAATLTAVVGVTAFVLLLDCWLFRAHLSAAYVRFFTSPLMSHTPVMCLKAAFEEVWYRLLLMTVFAFSVTAVRRQPLGPGMVALILVALQIPTAGIILADPVYASLRYFAVGAVWGWLYWRHGWVSALIGHVTCHLLLDPLLLIGLG